MKKAIAFIGIFLILTQALIGCANNANNANSGNNKNNNEANSPTIDSQPVGAIPIRNGPEVLFPDLHLTSYAISPHGNGIYAYASIGSAPDKWQIFFCNFDDGSVTPSYALPNDFVLDNLAALSDGSLIVAGYNAVFNENNIMVEISDSFSLYHLTSQRAQLLAQSPEGTGVKVFNNLAVSESENRIYALVTGGFGDGDAIYVYSITGEYLFQIATGQWVRDIVFSEENNTLYALQTDSPDMSVLVLDEEKQALREIARLPEGSADVSISQSQTDYGFYATHNSKVLGFDYSNNTFVELFDISTQGVSGWTPFVYAYDDFYVVYADNVASGTQRLWKIVLTDAYEGSVEVLRLGKFEKGTDFLVEQMIADFNFRYPQFLIELVDYSAYGDEAATRLHLDVIRGEAPDIFLMSEPLMNNNQLPVNRYIDSGALLDIAPYMSRDLDSDMFWGNALQTLYTNDACYIAVPTFSLYAIVASSAVEDLNFPDAGSFFEFLKDDFSNDAPRFAIDGTQEQFVVDMILANMEQFVDHNTGQTHFDSNEFIALLEVSKMITPSEGGGLLSMARGEGQLAFLEISHFADLQMYAVALQGDFKTIGLPGKPPGVVLIPHHIFGISAATQNREGAWAFLREVYENENLHNILGVNFTMNRAPFSKLAEQYTAQGAGNSSGGLVIDDGDSRVQISTDTADIVKAIPDHVEALAEQVDRLYLLDIDLLNIVTEELGAFFNGSRSAADTARVIQSRSQIYISEMK